MSKTMLSPSSLDSQLPASRSAAAGFDFTLHVRQLCAEMVSRLPELGHIDLSRVAIRFCQARKSVPHGLQASLTPLRFAGGALVEHRRGRPWTIAPVFGPDGRQMLYLLSFYLPRFLDRSLPEKLSIVVHELWHISPLFDGDLRRHPGRCYAHSHSQRQYDRSMEQLAARWLATHPPESVYEFLQHDFRQLQARHGRIVGARIATPKLIPAA